MAIALFSKLYIIFFDKNILIYITLGLALVFKFSIEGKGTSFKWTDFSDFYFLSCFSCSVFILHFSTFSTLLSHHRFLFWSLYLGERCSCEIKSKMTCQHTCFICVWSFSTVLVLTYLHIGAYLSMLSKH